MLDLHLQTKKNNFSLSEAADLKKKKKEKKKKIDKKQ